LIKEILKIEWIGLSNVFQKLYYWRFKWPGDCGCARVIQNKTNGPWRFFVMYDPSEPVPYPWDTLLPDAGEVLGARYSTALNP
jgi:hypothetical protein